MSTNRENEVANPSAEASLEQPVDRMALVKGFLAFCDRTVESVPAMPTMALVGPPGCGKTALVNELVAAKRWAVQCRATCPGLCSPIVRISLEPEPTPRNFEAAWRHIYVQELHRADRLSVDPRRTRLIFLDNADNLANATVRGMGIVLARMRHIAEEANVAFVLVGTGVLEALLNSLPYGEARFRIVRYPTETPAQTRPEATLTLGVREISADDDPRIA